MTKIITKKIQGVEVNGVFCEFDKPVLCEKIPKFEKIVTGIKHLYRYDFSKIKPEIDNTGELFSCKDWRFNFEPHHGSDYGQKTFIDENNGLMYHFYLDSEDSRLYLIVKKHDLAIEFSNDFELFYYEQNKLPSKRFVKNLLKWTKHKNIESYVNWLEKGWKRQALALGFQVPRPDWDGTMDKKYYDKLKKLENN